MAKLIILVAQAILCMKLVIGQQSTGTNNFGTYQPVYQEITGLPPNQRGYTLSLPSSQQYNVNSGFTQEQQNQLKAQEEFRRAVAEVNQKRINSAPVNEQLKYQGADLVQSAPSIELSKLTPTAQPDLTQQTSSSERFETIRATKPVVNIPVNDLTLQKKLFDAQKFREQAENARYTFDSSVADSVNDNSQIRQETRDGLKLSGLYSYSDGYFKRTVHYVADENGYRVVKEESEPIGTGPQFNPLGRIDVSTHVAGNTLQYSISGENLPPPYHSKPKKIIVN